MHEEASPCVLRKANGKIARYHSILGSAPHYSICMLGTVIFLQWYALGLLCPFVQQLQNSDLPLGRPAWMASRLAYWPDPIKINLNSYKN